MQIDNYFLVREIVGFLFLLDLLFYTPYFSIFFGRGYHQQSWANSKLSLAIIYLTWLSSSIFLIIGMHTLIASFLLWMIFRHFFIKSRWVSIFRGGGAPGFMSHYTMLYIFLFELSFQLDSSMALSKDVLFMFRIDLAFVLLCAGVYKAVAGYLHNDGMEYGAANPIWGYAFPIFKKLSLKNPIFPFQNIVGCILEIFMGILLLIPQAQVYGAIFVIIGFAYLLPLIRLGRLAVLMMSIPVLCLPDLKFTFLSHANHSYGFYIPPAVITVCHYLIYAYVISIPFIKIMQYVNLLWNKNFPQPLQNWLTKFANFVPIIMWRVFTADLTNFFIRIYEVDRDSNKEKTIVDEKTAYSYSHWRNLWAKFRFLQVVESICIVSIFTTLKYFKSKPDLFKEKLLRYSNTLKSITTSDTPLLRYEYVSIQKGEFFEYVPVGNYYVDLQDNSMREEVMLEDFDFQAKSQHSPIRETEGFGTYVKKS